jgi:ribosomal-protein-alanine N-acetyltransferase
LLLRDWVEDDWRLIWALANDPSVTRYQTKLRLPDKEACLRWLADAIQGNQQEPRVAYSLAVVLKETATPIGWLNWGDSEDPARGEVSFGYALLPTMWRRGFMSEAVGAMLPIVFDVQRRDSIYATCATSNPASAGVLEKTGLTLVERWMHRDDDLGIEEEYRRYRLDRTQWLSAR